jgi:hypothetical protein
MSYLYIFILLTNPDVPLLLAFTHKERKMRVIGSLTFVQMFLTLTCVKVSLTLDLYSGVPDLDLCEGIPDIDLFASFPALTSPSVPDLDLSAVFLDLQ